MNKIINKDQISPEDDPCGEIRPLYSSENLTISHVEVVGDARTHLHKYMEEIYYVTKGEGEVVLAGKIFKVREGDIIPIPKNTYHQLRKTNSNPFEIIFVTYPRFTLKDVYFQDESK